MEQLKYILHLLVFIILKEELFFMIFDYLKCLLIVEFGITIIIYLGAVLIDGSFNASKWNTSYNYDEVLNGWRVGIFVITTIVYFISILIGAKD